LPAGDLVGDFMQELAHFGTASPLFTFEQSGFFTHVVIFSFYNDGVWSKLAAFLPEAANFARH
jgi:hypothetical protein